MKGGAMRCPFLQEAQVKFCRASTYKKMIVRSSENQKQERCSSAEWRTCPSLKMSHEEHPSQDHCPFLEERLVQYCSGATGIMKYVPYAETALFRCGTDSHQYCETYIGIAHPGTSTQSSAVSPWETGSGPKSPTLEETICIPERVAFAPNHMWLDVSQDGWWHVGIDAFLAGILGRLERVTYATSKGIDRPTVAFRVRGVSLPVVFPLQMNIERTNPAVTVHPDKLLSEPYTLGWLFEGREPDHQVPDGKQNMPLLRGDTARGWMERELHRVTEFAHNAIPRQSGTDVPLMADGGVPRVGFLQQLSPEEILRLFNEFFSPYITWKG
jgi:glycine cleavage system H lipoate-binding protein